MAQLRDKQTSEIVFEGTPLEVATLANEIGVGEVLFDDVGEAFDHAAVVKANVDDATALESVAADTKESAELRRTAKGSAQRIRDEIANAKKDKPKTAQRIARAREEVEKRRG